jgi:hypothetical protein
MHTDQDDDVFLGAETTVIFPIDEDGEDPSVDDEAEEEFTLREAIWALLHLRHD